MGRLKIRKRNGEEQDFKKEKIVEAIRKADRTVSAGERLDEPAIADIAESIEHKCLEAETVITVEDIQDMVIMGIMEKGAFRLANNYIVYRYQHELRRRANTTDAKILAIVGGTSVTAREENSNKNTDIIPTQRDYIAGEVSRDLTRRYILPPDIMAAHDDGMIHFHDSDYSIQKTGNCCLVDLDDMLQHGTVITGTLIEKPHRFSTACNIATQIIAQVASSQYGGQSISMTHLARFVDVSRKAIRIDIQRENELSGVVMTHEQMDTIVEARLRKEVRAGIQTIQYQVLTLMTTNGQAPFITVFLYLGEAGDDERLKADLAICIEETLEQRIQGVKNEVGAWIAPSFPKLIYVLEEDNIHKDSRYFYLTELAARCSAKRMVPDYISEKIMKRLKVDENGDGQCYPVMGCRSALTPYVDPATGRPKYYGRWNQGVVTINLPYVAMSSGRDMDEFWTSFDEALELCHRALRIRHESLKGTSSDVAPIMWQYGALTRLEKGEKIDKLLYGGYSTISLGFAGLYEAVRYLTGHSHTEPEGKPLALAIMEKMNEKCMQWRQAEDIHYSLYGTPLESTTYKFAKALKAKFGIVEGVSDKDYITNSYHVHVTEPINAFDKLAFEAEFQALAPGGAISYVEVPNMQHNIPAVLAIIRYIYDNIMYAELNTKIDHCQVCGYDGEISIVEEDGKLIWRCPRCGNQDQHKLNVVRRTCGYLGSQFWNQGRTQEIRDRVLHI